MSHEHKHDHDLNAEDAAQDAAQLRQRGSSWAEAAEITGLDLRRAVAQSEGTAEAVAEALKISVRTVHRHRAALRTEGTWADTRRQAQRSAIEDRRSRVAEATAAGRSSSAIGAALGVSRATVDADRQARGLHLRRSKQRGYTLFEIMLVIAIIAAAMVGVMRFFSIVSVSASTQKEQASISNLVTAVRGIYAAAPSYAGIDMGIVEQARMDDVLRADGVPVSAFGGALSISAATVTTLDDAFAVQISQLDSKECAAVIPALAGQSAQVTTISGGNIQPKPDVVPDGASIATACASAFFQKAQGAVSFVYYTPRATAAAASSGPGCTNSCAPQNQSQTIACPAGQVGQINQTRAGTCSIGACPTQLWSPWTSISSSCAPAPIGQPTPVTPPTPAGPPSICTPATYQRNQVCPTGQTGIVVETQTRQCPADTLTPWTIVSSTCAPVISGDCQAGANQRIQPCPGGQFGQQDQMQNFTCDANGQPVDGPWYSASSNCSTTGSCIPSTASDGQRNVACSSGQFGQVIQQLQKSSTCASPTAQPIFGPDVVVSTTGACAACPAPATATQTLACPAGQTGSITQSQTTTYDCSAAPTTLPAPTVGPWINTANTCVVSQPICLPYGNGVANGVTVTPVNLTLAPEGSQGSVLGAYGSTSVSAAPTGTATVKLTYGGASTNVTATCTSSNNTAGGAGISCIGPNTAVTVGGVNFVVWLQTNGPFEDQGKYWDANVEVGQMCRQFLLAGTTTITTNVMNHTSPVSGQGTETPTESDISSGAAPVTWVIPVANRIGSGDGPFDPTGTQIHPYQNFLNLTGAIASEPQAGSNNPGYGSPTNPWASMYANGQYTVYAGPTSSAYAGVPADCTIPSNLMFATQFNSGYPVQLLYDAFSCLIGQKTLYVGPSGSPQAPPSGCPSSVSAKPLGADASHNAAPLLAPPCS
jgi:prepilin-type N-terminal cleavage/methylation domain-containing protein